MMTISSLDVIKHMSVFNPADYGHMSILVIGAGAVGSSIALGLAKLGLTNITVMDDDIVEPHNLPNQYVYGPDDVGRRKVTALEYAIERATETSVNVEGKRYESGKLQYDVVFMCVDTMAARKLITNAGLFINPRVKWAFDTRIDAYQGMSYAFQPQDLRQLASFREVLYDDAEVTHERGTCGNILSIGATAQIASQTTLWLFMQALTGKLTANEVIIQVSPQWNMLSRKFG
jgi:hypothetical protein